jgi:hypothetical protein
MGNVAAARGGARRVLYLECASGISGDMCVAALLDLGADRAALDRALASLPVGGFEARVGRVEKNGLAACDFAVVLDSAHENHDHDMAWLHGDGGHEHAHEGHAAHEHRTLADVRAVLARAELTPGARTTAERAFDILAAAEAEAHGTSPELVHFHEVGAVDSIVDVVAAAVCLDNLAPDAVVVGDIACGRGTVRCAHGVLPVPVPAVVNVARACGLVLRQTPVDGELATPTGAALAAAFSTGDALPERYRVLGCGLGAGKRPYTGCSGVLRAFMLEDATDETAPEPPDEAEVCLLETDVDDCDGETLGQLVGDLLAAGAKEAHYLPVFTKKNRPAWQLQVVCAPQDTAALERLVFEGTTTIGIRRLSCARTALERRERTLDCQGEPLRAKEVALPDGRVRLYPEHDDVARLARLWDVPYPDARRACTAACVWAETPRDGL